MNLPVLPPGLTLDALRAGVVVSLDPALVHPAIAVAINGELVHAARVRIPDAYKELPIGERARRVAHLCCVDLSGRVPYVNEHPHVTATCCERPQIYGTGHTNKDPNDLIGLALVCGGFAQIIGAPTLSPTPSEWAGATKKAKTGDAFSSGRWAVLSRKLRPEEAARVECTHDAVDAAGLLLHALGRLTRNFPGSVS